jgi:hypothetical protein
MKSTVTVLLRFSLALLFCIGMFVTANAAITGRPDKGDRKHCQKECKERYNHQKDECKEKRGGERRECKERAEKERHECQEKCEH